MSPCPHHPPRAHTGTPGPCRLGQRLHPLQCLREEEEAQALCPSPPCQPRSRIIQLFSSSSPCFMPFWSQVHFLLCAKTKGIPPGERQPALAPCLGHRSLGQGLGHWSQPGDTGSLPQGPGTAGSHAGSGQGGTQMSPPPPAGGGGGVGSVRRSPPGACCEQRWPPGTKHGGRGAPRGPQGTTGTPKQHGDPRCFSPTPHNLGARGRIQPAPSRHPVRTPPQGTSKSCESPPKPP